MLYWIHRVGHSIPLLRRYHLNHHQIINKNIRESTPNKWHWNNLFLFNDNWPSTIDLWITEVIPTLIFSLITGQWWISLFYYIWASIIQESIEHNPKVDLPILTSGRWHLVHHKQADKNFGMFFSVWDILFGTYQKP
jgi:sterol desaturase/sphingolipid hydroxylase (fatty acid hydroxylase superfamily)